MFLFSNTKYIFKFFLFVFLFSIYFVSYKSQAYTLQSDSFTQEYKGITLKNLKNKAGTSTLRLIRIYPKITEAGILSGVTNENVCNRITFRKIIYVPWTHIVTYNMGTKYSALDDNGACIIDFGGGGISLFGDGEYFIDFDMTKISLETVNETVQERYFSYHNIAASYGLYELRAHFEDLKTNDNTNSIRVNFCDIRNRNKECYFVPKYSGFLLNNVPINLNLRTLAVYPVIKDSGEKKGLTLERVCKRLEWFFVGRTSHISLGIFTVDKEHKDVCIATNQWGWFDVAWMEGVGIKILEGGEYNLSSEDITFKIVSGKEVVPDRYLTAPGFSINPDDPILVSSSTQEYDNAIKTVINKKFECEVDCNSSVMFFPGVMGSRLYSEAGDELWLSSNKEKQKKLALDENGKSVNKIITNTGADGLLNSSYGLSIYDSFVSDLNNLKEGNRIQDYSINPYDWRLSLEDIINASSTNDIYKNLKDLAANSKSGKVTIVAHSNGGLLAKYLIKKLKDNNDPLYDKIDKLILVAVPQVGTPSAFTALLHGEQIGKLGLGIDAATMRYLSLNMPTAYNLLPSKKLFNNISPILTFNNSIGQATKENYKYSIDSYDEMINYISNKEGRITPDYENIIDPAVGNSTLLSNAVSLHETLDDFTIPTSTEVHQIAGWGLYTKTGLVYDPDTKCIKIDGSTTKFKCLEYQDTFTLNDTSTVRGDETVLASSALYMKGDNVRDWWVDLKEYNASGFLNSTRNRNHSDIFEVSSLRELLTSMLTSTSSQNINLQNYISTIEPTFTKSLLGSNYTKISSHPPVYLTVIDDKGNITGYSTSTQQYLTNIPGSQYTESGETKTIYIPKDTKYTTYLTAYDAGSVTLDIKDLNEDTVVATTTYQAIPLSTTSLITIKDNQNNTHTLSLDYDGDSKADVVKTIGDNTLKVYGEEKANTQNQTQLSPAIVPLFLLEENAKRFNLATTSNSTSTNITESSTTIKKELKSKFTKKESKKAISKKSVTTKEIISTSTQPINQSTSTETKKENIFQKLKKLFFGE